MIESSGVDLRDGRVDYLNGQLVPLGDRIIVKPIKTELSLIIEAHARGRALRGLVVAVGPGEHPNKYNADRSQVRRSAHFRPTEVVVGDIVELGGNDIGGYAFPRVMLNGEEHLIACEKDVAGIHGRA